MTGRPIQSDSVLPWLGLTFSATVHPGGGGVALEGTLPWLLLVVPLAVFFLGSRPWRLVTGRQGALCRADGVVPAGRMTTPGRLA